MDKIKNFQGIDRLTLKIIAMICMLCDHMWATVISGGEILTIIGRCAFPIFAFQMAEAYIKTSNFKKLIVRLSVFALISEIPFDLMCNGTIFYPFHQNVMFTFLIALLVIRIIDLTKERGNFLLTIVVSFISCLVGFLVGTIFMVDYFGYGVLTVVLFYMTKDIKYKKIIQFIGLYMINVKFMGGYMILLPLFGKVIELPKQGLALLSLIFIWLYNGKKGKSNKIIQYSYYAFYPLHMLILALIGMYC